MNISDVILKLLEKDEERAFQLLFEHYYDSLLLYSFRILNNLEAAEDVIQDCFGILWDTKRLRGFKGDLDCFLFAMVKKRSYLFLRDRKPKCTLDELTVDIPDIPASFQEEEGEIELLYRTIGKLPEKCKQVFLMACLDDKTYQEIAETLGVSINTVKTQMKYALKFLRDNLREDDFSFVLVLLTKKV